MKRFAVLGLAEDGVAELVIGVRDQDEPPAAAEVVPFDPEAAAQALEAAVIALAVDELPAGATGVPAAPVEQPQRRELREGVKRLANGRPMLRPLIDNLPALAWWQVVAGQSYLIEADRVTVIYQIGAVPLDVARRRRKDEVDALLFDRGAQGVEVPGSNGKRIQLRPQDQPNVTAMVAQAQLAKAGGATWDAAFQWRMADNSFLPVPSADAMIGLAKLAADAVVRARKRAWAHKDAIEALGSVEAVVAYDITAGW